MRMWDKLSPRQWMIVKLVAEECLTNPQIAERLVIAEDTVKSHMGHIYEALGLTIQGTNTGKPRMELIRDYWKEVMDDYLTQRAAKTLGEQNLGSHGCPSTEGETTG